MLTCSCLAGKIGSLLAPRARYNSKILEGNSTGVMNALSGPVDHGETWRMEQFSCAYVAAVAAGAACSITRPGVDNDSVDLTLMRKTMGGVRRSPRLDVQVKATATDCVGPEVVRFALDIKNYDELRGNNFVVPRILVVVVMPPDVTDWMEHDEVRLALRRCGYWISLHGYPDTTNTSSITIAIPRGQVFSVQALDHIFLRLGQGEMP